MISPPGVEVTSASPGRQCWVLCRGRDNWSALSPRDWGTGIFFRSHTFICVCSELLFSVVWENCSGSWIPNKDKTCRILGRAGVRLLLNWQNFAGEGDVKWQPGSWLATRMTRLRRIMPPFLLSFKYHKDLMTRPPRPSHVVSACGLTLVIASWHCWHYASKCDHRGSLRVTNGHNTGPHPIRGLVTGHLSSLICHLTGETWHPGLELVLWEC